MLETPYISPEILPPGQKLPQILEQTARQYFRHASILTRPLLLPLLKIILGGYSCLALNYLFINTLSAPEHFSWAAQNLGLIFSGMLMITVATLWFFVAGFWELLVYFVSLNRNAMEIFCKQPAQTDLAYKTVVKSNAGAYQILLLAYVLIPLLLFILLSSASWGLLASQSGGDILATVASMAGVLALQLVGLIAWLAIGVLFTFVFQIAAFEKLPLNPLPVMLRSCQLVFARWPAILALHITLALLTTVIAPWTATTLLRLSRLVWPLDQFHLWLGRLIVQGAEPVDATSSLIPGYDQLFQNITQQLPAIAASCSDILISFVVTTLLLPLGALAFTRLYWDIQLQREKK
jgi:hypothetical protein